MIERILTALETEVKEKSYSWMSSLRNRYHRKEHKVGLSNQFLLTKCFIENYSGINRSQENNEIYKLHFSLDGLGIGI